MSNLFYKLFQVIDKNKKTYLFLTIMLFGILSWVASNVKFNEDISKLIPSNSENKILQEVLNTVNFSDKIIINISLDKGGDFIDLVDFATDFTDSISKHHNDYVKYLQGKVKNEDALETINFVYDNLPLYLSSEDYKIIDEKINEDSLRAITEFNFKTLLSPSGYIAKNNITKDPLGVSFLGLKKFKTLGINDGFKLRDGFLVSNNEKHILLFITPKNPSSNTSKNQIFSNRLSSLQKVLNEKYINKVKCEYFGGPLIAVANAKQIKTDIQLTVGIALTLLLVLFVLFYRRLYIPIILFIPTLFGGLLAVAILSLLRSEISAISLGIGAVLLGVTLDYSLHILTHIRNQETVETIYKNVSKPILMSSVTTSLAFLCLLFIESQALQDLGFFAAISVIGSSIFALFFLPQVYKLNTFNTPSKTSLIDAFANYKFNNNNILISTILVLLVLSLFTFGKVSFNNNLSQLNYIPNELKNAEKNLDSLINISSKSLYIIAFGQNTETVLQTNDSIFNIVSKLKKQQFVLDFKTISPIVTSYKNQTERIKEWQDFWTAEKKIYLKQTLTETGVSLGFKKTSFNDFYSLLEKDFKPLNFKLFSKIEAIPVNDFINTHEKLKTASSIIKVNDNQIDFIKNKFKNLENILIIDRQGINESFLGHLKSDFNRLIFYSLAFVIILLFLFYKSFKLTLVTILPIISTWFLTLGIMGLFNLEFNIFNIIISTFIFGLGVDYSIFMTNGLQQQSQNKSNKITTYKTSVTLSVITTLLGVGVLIFAKHPALHSLAIVSIIGITSAMFIVFTFQPFLYKFFITKPLNEISNGKN